MSNPFFNGNDVDDDEFLKNSRRTVTTTNNGYSATGNAVQQQDPRMQIREQMREIEQRTLESSNRSIGLLYESERTGQATAEELVRQKEQLKRTETRLDDINSTLKQSERHLQGIKSVFGGIRNYFRGGGNAGAATPAGNSSPSVPSSAASSQAATVANAGAVATDAAVGRLDDVRGSGHPGLRVQGRAEGGYPSASADVNAALDRNLDEMALGLSRLKGLAQNMNSELDEHSELIDVIDDKVAKHGIKIQHQNREMNKILNPKSKILKDPK